MARADIRVNLRDQGASLRVIAREMRGMDARKVNGIYRRHLETAAAPFPARVRASVLAIPTTGTKHTGLRARIADCVELSTGADAKEAWASVWVNPFKMTGAPGTLALYMEGVKESRTRNYTRWRHPVYGRREDPWVTQAAHPYFYQAASPFGRAAGEEMRRALDDISRKISG